MRNSTDIFVGYDPFSAKRGGIIYGRMEGKMLHVVEPNKPKIDVNKKVQQQMARITASTLEQELLERATRAMDPNKLEQIEAQELCGTHRGLVINADFAYGKTKKHFERASNATVRINTIQHQVSGHVLINGSSRYLRPTSPLYILGLPQ